MKKISPERLLFFSGIFVLNFLLTVSEIFQPLISFRNSMSAKYNHICDPTDENPCGNLSLECKLDLNNVFTCTDRVQLGQRCKADEDCNEYISRAECSKQKTCVCKSGSIQASKVSCFPLLGEFCEDHETCQPNNSICFDNLCQCADGYLPYSNRICSPILLGTFCKNNTDCIGVKHAECSKKNYCRCKDHTVEINPSRCVVTPNFNCESNNQCEENKFCINHRCQCKPGFHLGPDFECVSVLLGMDCETDKECNNLIKHSICSEEKKCQCDQFHYPIENSFCVSTINDACKNSELCANTFTLCLDDKCHCQPNYVYNGTDCVPASKN